jgi:hypothetical protein
VEYVGGLSALRLDENQTGGKLQGLLRIQAVLDADGLYLLELGEQRLVDGFRRHEDGGGRGADCAVARPNRHFCQGWLVIGAGSGLFCVLGLDRC